MVQIFGQVVYVVAAIFISISDLRYRIIRNRDLLLFFIVSLACNYSNLRLESLRSLFYVSLFCIALNQLFQGKIGAGDLKLFWVISIWTSNFTKWLEGLTIAWILGGLFAIAFSALNFRRTQRKMSIPFAPFIFLGFLPAI
jgi:Flp pilus assembly protein protease CpaA